MEPPGHSTRKPEMMRKNKGAVIYGAGGAVGSAVVRACAREGGHAVSHRAPPGARRRCRQGSAFRRRTRRDGGGRRARRTRRGPASTVGDRHGGPRRYLVPRDRHRVEHDAAGCARGRAGGRAMLPADCDRHQVVLSDRTPGRPADGRAAIGGDHDRHVNPLTDGPPIDGRRRSGDERRGGAHANLSAELAPHGIRVVGLRPQGMPESGTIKAVFGLHAKA